MSHTQHPLTYTSPDSEKAGDNYLIAVVDFGSEHWHITTDHVRASQLVLGEPEADVRLWSAAPGLLATCKELASIVGMLLQHVQMDALTPAELRRVLRANERGVAALAKAKGKVEP